MREEETRAFENGFEEMLGALRIGKVPSQDGLLKEFNDLFSLSPQTEHVQTVERGKDGEINKTVTVDRSAACVPSHRFFGSICALLEFSRSCRTKGVVPE